MSQTQFYPIAVVMQNNEPHVVHHGASHGSLAHAIVEAKALRETSKSQARPALEENAFYAVVGVQGFNASILSSSFTDAALSRSIVSRFETNVANALRIR